MCVCVCVCVREAKATSLAKSRSEPCVGWKAYLDVVNWKPGRPPQGQREALPGQVAASGEGPGPGRRLRNCVTGQLNYRRALGGLPAAPRPVRETSLAPLYR